MEDLQVFFLIARFAPSIATSDVEMEMDIVKVNE